MGNRTALYRLLRHHGLSVRDAIAVMVAIMPADPLLRTQPHPRGVVFEAAVAHYLRRVSAGEGAEEVRAELRRWAGVVVGR